VLAQQLVPAVVTPLPGLEGGDDACRHAVVMKGEVRALAHQAAHRLGGLGACQHDQARIVVHREVVGLTGAPRQRLHVGDGHVQEPVHRGMAVRQLEQPQGQRVGGVRKARQEAALYQDVQHAVEFRRGARQALGDLLQAQAVRLTGEQLEDVQPLLQGGCGIACGGAARHGLELTARGWIFIFETRFHL
jgi:hypothetical protein